MTVVKKLVATVAVLGLVCAFLAGLWQFGRLLLAFGLIWLAARNAIDQAVAVRSGYAEVPQARQIDEIIGNAVHSVMNEGDETEEGVNEEWISEAYFGGRYELVMTVDIRVDRRTSGVSKVMGTPIFRLLEMESVQMSNGSASVSYRASAQREFDSIDWKRVVEANGDFSAIGIQIENAPPIANFDEFVQETKRRARLNSKYVAR